MQSINSEQFDVIIIGGGAAGMSAAVWCDELSLKALLLESADELGGQLLWTYNAIRNYLGIEVEDGRELQKVFVTQTQSRKFLLKTKSEVSVVDVENKRVELKSGESFSAKFLIIAAGIRRRKLGVEGEESFKGRGIIESGKRDAEMIKNKKVCVIGGGDAALENALILAETASEVILIHRRGEFRGRPEFIEPALNNKKIRILMDTRITKIIGGEKLNALELENLKTGEPSELTVDALLVRIGVEPNTGLFQGNLEMDNHGYIKINNNCETSVKNVFAIGDVANPLSPTISSAVGMGATASKVILSKLK